MLSTSRARPSKRCSKALSWPFATWIRFEMTIMAGSSRRLRGGRPRASVAGDGHAGDLKSWSGDAAPQDEVVAHHLDLREHLVQVAGDGDFLYGEGHLPPLDPEAGRPPGVVAGHQIDPEA